MENKTNRSYSVNIDGIFYEYCPETKSAIIVSTCISDEVINVPSTITVSEQCYTVTKVHDYAFRTCSASRINLPKSITEIGHMAFKDSMKIDFVA